MTSVLLVEDHPFFRDTLRTFVDGLMTIDVVGVAVDAGDAIAKVRHLQPQVVLMDIELPDQSGLKACEKLKADDPETLVLLYSGHDSEAVACKARRVADGFLCKASLFEDLASEIDQLTRQTSSSIS